MTLTLVAKDGERTAQGRDFANTLTRDIAIQRIRQGLNSRSKTRWSVTGGRGTAWGWIHITARKQYATMTEEEQTELGELLGIGQKLCFGGESVPAGHDYWAEYIDRAEGRAPRIYGRQYWD